MIVLDTDTRTHFSYGNANVRRRMEAIADEPLAVTVITRNEVLRGRGESLLKAARRVGSRIWPRSSSAGPSYPRCSWPPTREPSDRDCERSRSFRRAARVIPNP